MADYFYARVSALDQNLDRQLVAATGCGVPSANVFTEKLSGMEILSMPKVYIKIS